MVTTYECLHIIMEYGESSVYSYLIKSYRYIPTDTFLQICSYTMSWLAGSFVPVHYSFVMSIIFVSCGG